MSASSFDLLGIGVGTLLAGRYEIEEVLGRGGMAAVFGVRDMALDRELCALKILDPKLCEEILDQERFRQEVLISRKLTHPNIVRTFEFGQLATGQKFVVMEHVRGKSLETLLAEHPAGIPISAITPILIEVARAMAHAHDHGVVHRDLKPGNILVSHSGDVKIVDFGLARSRELQAKLTQAGECVGTPLYMAPEQVQGEIVDHRVDIYALGIIAYELASGVPPYEADAWFQLASQIISQPLPRLGRRSSSIPNWFDEFIRKASAKNPAERFQSMLEAADFLEEHKDELPQSNKGMAFITWMADGLGHALQRQATMVVILSSAFLLLLVSLGLSQRSVRTVNEKVETGTSAVGKVVDTLSKLNKVVVNTYENSEAINRYLDEQEKKRKVLEDKITTLEKSENQTNRANGQKPSPVPTPRDISEVIKPET